MRSSWTKKKILHFLMYEKFYDMFSWHRNKYVLSTYTVS